MRALLAAWLVLVGVPAGAEVYRWVDEDGTTHYSDRPRDEGTSDRLQLREINSIEAVEYQTAEPGNEPAARDVVMYSASWCPVCKQAREYFEANDIDYVEHDVETTAKGRRDYEALNGRGVPIILVGDRRMNGFSPGGFERLYHQ